MNNTASPFQQECDNLTQDVRQTLDRMQTNIDEADEALWEALREYSRRGRLTCGGLAVVL